MSGTYDRSLFPGVFERLNRYQLLLLSIRQLRCVVFDFLQQPFRACLPGVRIVVPSAERREDSKIAFRLIGREYRKDISD